MSAGKPRIAIIGTGISGLTCAHYLQKHAQLTLFEAGAYVGGHVNTIDVRDSAGQEHAVDTGFIVFNKRTYPNFIKMITDLGVQWQDSDMSFSVKATRENIEYCGNNLNCVFGQRRNLLRPAFWKMLREILRFNRDSVSIDQNSTASIGEYLDQHGYSQWFKRYYITPMGSAIWSSSFNDTLNMPAVFFIRFFENHGMLSVNDQPQWYTISNGSRSYVKKLIEPLNDQIKLNTPIHSLERCDEGIRVHYQGDSEVFDKVICACHADTALQLLQQPNQAEQDILSQFPYSRNEAVLHTDTSILPRRQRTWASWNYLIEPDNEDHRAALTYNMNRLQNIKSADTFLVTLNTTEQINPEKIHRVIPYQHPVFKTDAHLYQQRHEEVSGQDRIYYCGAYWRNGFHEDGCFSGLQVCRQLGVDVA